MLYPLVVSAVGILSGLLTMGVARLRAPVEEDADVEARLKFVLVLCSVIQSIFIFLIGIFFLPGTFVFAIGPSPHQTTSLQVTVCCLTGLWAGLLIGVGGGGPRREEGSGGDEGLQNISDQFRDRVVVRVVAENEKLHTIHRFLHLM